MLSLDKCFRLSCISSLFLLVTSSCVDLPPQYGIVTLQITASQEVYFKREVRGLHYDHLVLSPSKDFCREPNPKSDYIFRAQGPRRIYYKRVVAVKRNQRNSLISQELAAKRANC